MTLVYFVVMICKIQYYKVLRGEFLPSRQMCNLNAKFNLHEFNLLNTCLKEVLVCILVNFKFLTEILSFTLSNRVYAG